MEFQKIFDRLLGYGLGVAGAYYFINHTSEVNQKVDVETIPQDKLILYGSLGATALGTGLLLKDISHTLSRTSLFKRTSFVDCIWDDNRPIRELKNLVNKAGTKAKINQEIIIIPRLDTKTPKKYEALNTAQQQIIIREIQNEGIPVSHYSYGFTNCSLEKLPRSTYQEIIFEKFPENIKNECIDTIRRISNLESSIIKNGYYPDFPIVLRVLSHTLMGPKIRVIGGNHRLQAVRNLIGARKLSPRFQIPCLLLKKTYL